MIRNYFKVGWRNLKKSKVYSSINIIGLATGMAIALLIGLWIWDELSFNYYHHNYTTIAKVMSTQTFNGQTGTAHTTVVPLEKELRTKYGSSFKRLSLTWTSTHILATGDKKISSSGRWAQPDLPEMLTLRLNKGRMSAFNDPSSLLLSMSLANALFGDEDPINKIIRVDNKTDMTVGGVYEDLPKNSTFHEMKFLLPWYNTANWWNTQTDAWSNHGCELFVQVDEHVDFTKTTSAIKNITQEHGYTQSNEQLLLHPMDRWHLYTDAQNFKVGSGRIQTVWLFGFIGVFVLLLACINFMNLSTARSEKRAKEVGIRKAVGSLRGQLVRQFLSESLMVTFLALMLTLILVSIALPSFNLLADKETALPWNNLFFWFIILGFTLLTGLLSGSYPAFYLSGFNPVKVLKGTFSAGRFASIPRKVLVVVQFTVSIVLIIGTIVVFRQIRYAKDRPVGYTREGLLSVEMNTPEIYEHYNALRADLIATGAVENMGESNSEPTQIWSNNNGFDWRGKDPTTDPLFGTIAVTHDYGKTIGWKITDGRDLSREHLTDSTGVILNQSAVKLTGLQNPVGQIMKWKGKDHVIVGVVEDIVMESPYQPPVPTVFLVDYGWLRFITVRVKPTMSIQTALSKIEPVFRKYNPGSPFEYKFIDEEYARKFSDEQRIGSLATVFAILAIFISCLGLFGLASFVAERRTKEIGVRKVLGASVFNVWRLLSKEFVTLVIISLFIASAASYYFMNNWLQNYQYRANLSWWIFATAGIGALTITLLTVSFQAIKAAIANPVKSLRTE
jgi:putative ABC transport system permease protein